MRAIKSIAIGIAATLGLFGLAMIGGLFNQGIAKLLFWQCTVLLAFIPEPNIYGGALAAYRGVPLIHIAIMASFPIGFVFYSSAAYIWLGRREREV